MPQAKRRSCSDMNLLEASNSSAFPMHRSGKLARNLVLRPALQLRANRKILTISSARSGERQERERENERGRRKGEWKRERRGREIVEAWLRIQRPSSRRQGDKFQLSRFQTGHLFSRSCDCISNWRSIALNEITKRSATDIYKWAYRLHTRARAQIFRKKNFAR